MGIAVSPDAAKVYVADYGNSSVDVITRRRTPYQRSSSGIGATVGVTVSLDSAKLYVTYTRPTP